MAKPAINPATGKWATPSRFPPCARKGIPISCKIFPLSLRGVEQSGSSSGSGQKNGVYFSPLPQASLQSPDSYHDELESFQWQAVRELMPAFFELLKEEIEPAVRVVLGHFMFVYIHPYMDGNGRMGRFLMNLMLASGGYPWTIVPLERRTDYMTTLESASVDGNIMPFAMFLVELLRKSR